jgi:glutathione S-transferase
MLALYMSPGSSSMATHIMLHEIGVDFESRWVSFAKREQHALEYLALNPDGKVPTLLVDGHPLTEVAATLYYLAKGYPAAGLFPVSDLDAEAQIISWMSFIASYGHYERMMARPAVKKTIEIEAAVGYQLPQ